MAVATRLARQAVATPRRPRRRGRRGGRGEWGAPFLQPPHPRAAPCGGSDRLVGSSGRGYSNANPAEHFLPLRRVFQRTPTVLFEGNIFAIRAANTALSVVRGGRRGSRHRACSR